MPHNYGTVESSQNNRNGLLDTTDQERATLLGKPDRGQSTMIRVRNHFDVNLNKKWGDLALLLCYIITGLLDSSSVQVWGSFVSMQTGNTVYLGLGIIAPTESTRWIRSGISIGCFCLGSMMFGHFHRYFGGRKRWVMVTSYGFQVLCMVGAALMVSLGPQTGSGGAVSVWIGLPLALIAFQSGGQAYTSRVLQYGGLTSVVLTSIYCDLFSDAKLFAGLAENVERNRRTAAPILLLIGAMIGGVWAHSSVGLAGSLWSAVGLKFLITLGWAFWPAEKE
ncbi:hypothetical protein KC367_g4789 [Hortaea werneckii]|uniref:DUF1275 domain protein n=1 Tax=Hortaea werneckii TaxID=91943 RepID=A0A3M7JE31_HORWE|nr:hypothetical protein KC358_g7737 [Hortaea werneckii]KAI6832041.1 hypothetical protein KC342_g7534 [Hortaea werneckii]KAI6832138.1 hypothetical protein KC350_g7195 [Hortaea werneckii]KAI6928178.1 hypothetical protein KC348_g8193 [Hortaea werneckii]KAI6934462.1 hypothetical protein KC341_g7597 [Hortaea werneckii]